MALWMVRAGRHGEQENFALENNYVVIGWDDLPDLTPYDERENLDAFCKQFYESIKTGTVSNWIGQLWAFRGRINIGDLVVLPLKSHSAVAIGRITSDYQYNPNNPDGAKHYRNVEWINKDIPRSAFDQDLLYSLGAFLTVCQIQRNKAEERILAMLSGKAKTSNTIIDDTDDTPEGVTDLAEYARDQIIDYIGKKFRGHDLERLVNAILKAQGFYTQLTLPGADGGVDILAGRGKMGFDSPRLCVQVKSIDTPIDISVFRELQGTLKNFGAEQGLLVAWGGFKNTVVAEARRCFFEIRLWDSGDIVNALVENYDQLSEDIQAEIPLKQAWVLVLEE